MTEQHIDEGLIILSPEFVPTDMEILIIDTITKWRDILGLGQWRIAIDLGWIHESIPCRISTEWAYLCAELSINIALFERMAPQIIEETLVHELTHVLLAEMRTEDLEDLHEERTATIICRLFIRLQQQFEHEQSRNLPENKPVSAAVGKKSQKLSVAV